MASHCCVVLQASQYSIDAKLISEYFTIENCLVGLDLLVRRLFGLSFLACDLVRE
jgi:Zn-dependent oligopeptidase